MRRWPVLRSAAAIRADLEALAAITTPGEWSELWTDLTDPEHRAHDDADFLRLRSGAPLTHDGRQLRAPIEVPPWVLAIPGLPEPACVLYAALLEVPYARSWSELGARFGVPSVLLTREHEPTLHAALDELLRARLVRRVVTRGADELGAALDHERLEAVRRG